MFNFIMVRHRQLLAGRRRHRHHEHHAGDGDRAHAARSASAGRWAPSSRHITLQFLIETTVISLTGGLIGIALGTGVAKLLPIIVAKLRQRSNYPTAITSWCVVGSFIVSGMIGIGFGLYPAMMAARMNPIEALRHE